MFEQQKSSGRKRASMILFTGIAMSLGWGLRGYIGGGPFGAMIPGLFVALMLCHNLGYSLRAASVVVAFGTIGVAFGGNMTYGQTLGLIRLDETFLWGLTGTTVKGGVWGLLGGAVLGLGFIARCLTWRQLVTAVVLMLIGITAGLYLVNQPRLIYFSNPIDRPRDESWAGYLTGGILLLSFLFLSAPKVAWAPIRFSIFGAVGGAIGFGIGSLFLAFQPNLPEPIRWLPCWKFMEFFFGFTFGIGLGTCTFYHRDRLVALASAPDDSIETTEKKLLPLSVSLLSSLVAVPCAYFAATLLMPLVMSLLADLPDGDIRRTTVDVFLGFTGIGALLIVLSRRWETVAWQITVSVTIMAAAIDWQRDLLPQGGINMPPLYRFLFVACITSMAVTFVSFWQLRRPGAKLMELFIFAVCVLMGIGYLMGLALSDVLWMPPESVAAAGGQLAYIWKTNRGEIVVHSIFAMLFVTSLIGATKELRQCEHG